jgi:hypothetical protein
MQREISAKHLAKFMRDARCQQFFLHAQHSSYFEVFSPDMPISTPAALPTSIAAEVRSELAMLEERRIREGEVMHDSASTKEVSPEWCSAKLST